MNSSNFVLHIFSRTITNQPTNQLHWAVFLEILTVIQLVKNPPPFMEPTSLRFILILSSHVWMGLLSSVFPSGFPTEILHEFLIIHMYATCLIHLIHLNLITPITFGEAYKLWSSSLCCLRRPPATSSLLGPNILLSTQFSYTVNLWSSLSVGDQVPHPYKTTGKIMILYILIFYTGDRNIRDSE